MILFSKDGNARLIEKDENVYLKTKDLKLPVLKIFHLNGEKYYLNVVDLHAQLMLRDKYAFFFKETLDILYQNNIKYVFIQIDSLKRMVPVEDVLKAAAPISRYEDSNKYLWGFSVNLVVNYPKIKDIKSADEINDEGNPKIGDKVEFGGNVGVVQAITEKSYSAYVKFPIIGIRLIKRDYLKRSGENEWREI